MKNTISSDILVFKRRTEKTRSFPGVSGPRTEFPFRNALDCRGKQVIFSYEVPNAACGNGTGNKRKVTR